MNVARFNGSLRVASMNAWQHLEPLERAYTRVIRQAGREAAANLQQLKLTAAVAPDDPNWQLPAEGVLLSNEALVARATARLGKIHRQIVSATASKPLARAGIAWDVTHPLSQNLLDLAAQRTGTRLAQTVQPIIRESVLASYADGLSVADAAAAIREKVADVAPWQARMLARTDLNSLANGGSVMAASMAGLEFKQWLTAEDDRVRETHMEADGQVVPIDQQFDVGGESLDYPGDPAGSDEEVCNCRCTVLYLDAAEATTASAHRFGRVPSAGMAVVNGRASVGSPERSSRMPGRGFAAAPTAAPVEPPLAAGAAWVSDIAFEGAATGDGRYMLPGSLTWREPPLTLMAMTETSEGGHLGAFVAGRMDTFAKSATNMDGEKLPDGVTAIQSRGVFDVAGEDGAEVARLVADETVRGISVDLAVDDWVFRDPESGELIEVDEASEDDMERAFFGELQFAVRQGTILAATVCPTPAFADARIALAASADGKRVIRVWAPFKLAYYADIFEHSPGSLGWVTASGMTPSKPPKGWFFTPEASEPTPLTVTKDGRVYGHMALWESCHTGYPGRCVPPPSSPSGYRYFNLGEVECADGERVSAGAITLEALHADTDRPLSVDRVRAHYEHTGVVAAYVRAVDGKHGIWVSGALRASLSEQHARDLMGAKPSGDWRQVTPGGPLEMLGVHAVNEPGYPVPRLVAAALLPSGDRVVFEFDEPSGRVPSRGFARVA